MPNSFNQAEQREQRDHLNTSQLLQEIREVGNKVERIKDRLDYQDRQLDTIAKLLNGDITSPEKGVIVRLDRLEQDGARREWWMKASVGASISALITMIFETLKHWIKP